MTYCIIHECMGKTVARNLCAKHYKRWQNHGDPLHIKMTEKGEPMRWLDGHVSYSADDCLFWPFARSKDGYAILYSAKACRVMCEKKRGKPPKKRSQAAHSCGRGHLGCISPVHLRWASPKENSDDRAKHGTDNSGERNGRAKLSANDVAVIRELHAAGRQQKELASIFGCATSTIWHIVADRSWIGVAPEDLEREAGKAA